MSRAVMLGMENESLRSELAELKALNTELRAALVAGELLAALKAIAARCTVSQEPVEDDYDCDWTNGAHFGQDSEAWEAAKIANAAIAKVEGRA